MIYLQLFLSFLQIGAFSVGGGYAAISLIQEQVLSHGWMTLSEFTDLISIAEMTPGPIAVNSATFVGIRMAGVLGALIATFGCILPSLFIVSILAFIYEKYRNLGAMKSVLSCLRPVVVSLILSAGLSILNIVIHTKSGGCDWIGITLFLVAFLALRKYKVNSILVLIGTGVAGLIFYMFFPL